MSTTLSDPLIRTMIAADNVDPVKLASMLRRVRGRGYTNFVADYQVPLRCEMDVMSSHLTPRGYSPSGAPRSRSRADIKESG